MTLEDLATVFVVLSDWRGHVVWTSRQTEPSAIGEFVWQRLVGESQEKFKEVHAKVASLREAETLLVINKDEKLFRCWLWPLDTPEIAVCTLCREVPSKLSILTDRELECLKYLAQGIPVREIADQLSLSTSTLHTHLARVREKLDLENLEALISFAARYCYPPSKPLIPDQKD